MNKTLKYPKTYKRTNLKCDINLFCLEKMLPEFHCCVKNVFMSKSFNLFICLSSLVRIHAFLFFLPHRNKSCICLTRLEVAVTTVRICVINICKSLRYEGRFDLRGKTNAACRALNCAFIKFDLWVNESVSLAKKPFMLTVMVKNTSRLPSLSSPDFTFLDKEQNKCAELVSTQRYCC